MMFGCRDPSDFTTLATTSVIPVDLNAFMLGVCVRPLTKTNKSWFLKPFWSLTWLVLWWPLVQMELNIAFSAKVTGDYSTAQQFLQLSDHRKKALNSVFWNANMKQWLDYWLTNSTCQVLSIKSWVHKFSIIMRLSTFCDSAHSPFRILLGNSSLESSAAESKCFCFQFCSFVDATILLR